SALLIHAFSNEIRGIVLLEFTSIFEWEMPLRKRHRARIKPCVDHLRNAAHRTFTMRAFPRVPVDIGFVGIERFAEWLANFLFELLETTDSFDMGIVGVANP